MCFGQFFHHLAALVFQIRNLIKVWIVERAPNIFKRPSERPLYQYLLQAQQMLLGI
ncbi:hypothetical protein [Sphingorhabdus sp. EL138]|uniref:hypothetical protein n=1 Tax=Sphingorhabdus sp. EL138 TaxID=2073156 RepID=UPI001573F25B|nr:hypothetical protein [Sphingorhabdus sp. EL138]